MFITLIVATIPVGIILLCSELLWRRRVIKGERARKFIHILAGIWMAFWPLYVPFDGIFLLGMFSMTLLLYSRFTKLFHAIYAVKRRTFGELFFALSIVVCSYLGREPWIFTTSLLLLALADGGAAVAGRYWGLRNQYFVFGLRHLRKSVVGTVTYIVLAFICLAVGYYLDSDNVLGANLVILIGLPFGLALVENTSPYGLDNILTPLLATLVLNSMV